MQAPCVCPDTGEATPIMRESLSCLEVTPRCCPGEAHPSEMAWNQRPGVLPIDRRISVKTVKGIPKENIVYTLSQ